MLFESEPDLLRLNTRLIRAVLKSIIFGLGEVRFRCSSVTAAANWSLPLRVRQPAVVFFSHGMPSDIISGPSGGTKENWKITAASAKEIGAGEGEESELTSLTTSGRTREAKDQCKSSRPLLSTPRFPCGSRPKARLGSSSTRRVKILYAARSAVIQ